MNQSASIPEIPDFLKLLAHEVRWQLLGLLATGDFRVTELVSLLGLPQNAVSYHLRLLREGEIVHEQRSAADGRDVYYRLDLPELRRVYQESALALHPALLADEQDLPDPQLPRRDASLALQPAPSPAETVPFRVLFLCTHNSARSQLAEGILRAKGGELVDVVSAGNEPGVVHPLAIRAARALSIDISKQESKDMDKFSGQTFDYIITVCDRVREICPTFPGDPHQIHWSFPDPAAVTGTEKERYAAFLQTARELNTRISYLHLMLQRRREQESAP